MGYWATWLFNYIYYDWVEMAMTGQGVEDR